jgi:hypothetical protein
MKEMLTEKYIGPQAETLFPWVKDVLQENGIKIPSL